VVFDIVKMLASGLEGTDMRKAYVKHGRGSDLLGKKKK
jgi:hypothetical protein